MAEEKWSQASTRRNEIMLDQHGRQYATIIEIRTGHPISIMPLFEAPLMPPVEDARVVRMRRPNEGAQPGWRNPYCKIVIDYDAWIEQLQRAHEAYQEKKHALAIEIGGSRAVEEFHNPSPMLLRRLGEPPQPIEPVLQAKAGQPWLLGLRREDGTPYPKPPEAEKYFPEKQQAKVSLWGGAQAAETQPAAEVFPKPIPGGRFRLSDGRVVKCSREDAEDLEQKVQDEKNAEQLVAAGAEAGIGPGWE